LANHTKAFENYDINAIITQEPFRTELIKKGYHEIFTSKSIPYEITDFLVTRESVIKEKKDQLIQLVNGFFKARRYKNKKSAKALKILSGRTGLTTGEFNNSLSLIKILTKYDNEQKLINNREAFVQKQRKVAARMERYGLLNNIRFNEPLIDTTIINQVTKK
jgi:NitT/TauT family transport system substrate-binding protein